MLTTCSFPVQLSSFTICLPCNTVQKSYRQFLLLIAKLIHWFRSAFVCWLKKKNTLHMALYSQKCRTQVMVYSQVPIQNYFKNSSFFVFCRTEVPLEFLAGVWSSRIIPQPCVSLYQTGERVLLCAMTL